ncbi:MAG: 1-phosphofructokinase [Paenibacillaceae bacterium]
MITTVTLNAAIDKTYYLESFKIGQVSRVKTMHAVAGGKGINVARVIQQLGYESLIIGFAGGDNGHYIRSALNLQSLRHEFIEVSGESRINLNIIENEKKTSTEILETGPFIEGPQISEFLEVFKNEARQSKVVVLSGSLPPGVPVHFYKTLIDISQQEGALAILDTSGEALKEGLKAKPFMIKPNEDELKAITGQEISTEAELLHSVRGIMEQGIDCVAVSLGAKGSIVGNKGHIYRVHTPAIEVVNPVGCGDSYMAGFAIGLERGVAIEECLMMAAAAGTANAMSEEAGNVKKDHYLHFLKETHVTRID